MERPPKTLWALFDSQGVLCNVSGDRDEVEDDAWGPRFRDGYTVREYRLVPRKDESK